MHHDLPMPPALTMLTSPIKLVIADSMVLMRTACRLAAQGSSYATSAAMTGRMRMFIPAEVEDEVPSRLVRVAKSVSVEAAQAAWRDQLAPAIRVVDLLIGDLLRPGLRPIVAIDSDDVAIGALAMMLGQSLVWSEDRSLTSTGFASPLGWLETGEALSAVASTEAAWSNALMGTAMAGSGVIQLLIAGARFAARGWPQALITGALISSGALLLRGRAGDRWRRVRTAAATGFQAFGTAAAETVAHRDSNESRLIAVRPSGLEDLVDGAARLLARAPEPMTASEIRDQLLIKRLPGVPDKAVTAAAIERHLRAHPAFNRQPGKKWVIGRPVRHDL